MEGEQYQNWIWHTLDAQTVKDTTQNITPAIVE